MFEDFPILAAVAANPTHPYALLEHLNTLGVRATRSTLYRRVEALVAQGWIEADDIRGANGHFRRALSISRASRERVSREAAAVLREQPLESPLFSLAVAVARQQPEAGLVNTLRPRMALAARQLTTEERTLHESAAPEWERATRERRIAHLQADISWLQGLLGRRIVAPRPEPTRRAG